METTQTYDHDPHAGLLARPPEEWPQEAQDAYRKLLSELNDWCKERGCSPASNPRVAAQAVREVWSTPYGHG